MSNVIQLTRADRIQALQWLVGRKNPELIAQNLSTTVEALAEKLEAFKKSA